MLVADYTSKIKDIYDSLVSINVTVAEDNGANMSGRFSTTVWIIPDGNMHKGEAILLRLATDVIG